MQRCEICGGNATNICPRCYRYVCEKCTDPTSLLCVDCSSFKRWREEDLMRSVESLEKKVSYVEKVLERCFECPLLKDEIMRSLWMVKNLEATAKVEGMEELSDRLIEVRDKVQKLGVEYLVKFKMRSQ